MFAGLGAARIRRLFKEARENAPAIVFIDELDAVGTERGSDISGERDQTLNQLLVEMDGFDGARQRRRDGRLEPAREARQGAAAARAASTARSSSRRPTCAAASRSSASTRADKPLAQDVDLERVARHTAGLTGADLANLCNEAAILAGRSRRDFIAQADFDDAFERVVAGLQSRKVMTDHEKRVSPGTRPGTRWSPSCCRPSTRSRRSRSSPAARRSATRSTCPRRTAT